MTSTTTSTKNQPIDIAAKLSSFSEYYSPRRLASIDGSHDIKLAKLKGPFVWHSHPDADELFYVLSGTLIIHFAEEDGGDVELNPGQMFLVKRGVKHMPETKDGQEAHIMLIEKMGVVNTGDAEGNLEGLKNEVKEF
ncbi:RmlC-like cupin domain-containing protein [Flagelloscypha sp. PMI_526]|nr:RmlC-like cupin domain-containing protein [Flagelloscypha sp. PMI_526]